MCLGGVPDYLQENSLHPLASAGLKHKQDKHQQQQTRRDVSHGHWGEASELHSFGYTAPDAGSFHFAKTRELLTLTLVSGPAEMDRGPAELGGHRDSAHSFSGIKEPRSKGTAGTALCIHI